MVRQMEGGNRLLIPHETVEKGGVPDLSGRILGQTSLALQPVEDSNFANFLIRQPPQVRTSAGK